MKRAWTCALSGDPPLDSNARTWGATRPLRSYTRWKLSRRATISSPEANSVSSQRFSSFQPHQPPPSPLVRSKSDDFAGPLTAICSNN